MSPNLYSLFLKYSNGIKIFYYKYELLFICFKTNSEGILIILCFYFQKKNLLKEFRLL